MTRGFSDKDLWNLDQVLAPYIAKRLKAFRKHSKYSHPSSLESIEEWGEVLDSMIYAFERIASEEEIELPKMSRETVEVDGTRQTKINPVCEKELEEYKRKVAEEREKVSRGLSLFAKHFEDLWE